MWLGIFALTVIFGFIAFSAWVLWDMRGPNNAAGW